MRSITWTKCVTWSNNTIINDNTAKIPLAVNNRPNENLAVPGKAVATAERDIAEIKQNAIV